MDQIKPIKITVGDEEYILRFTRKTMIKAEQEGFDPSKMNGQPLTMCYLLFYHALLADRPMFKREAADDLLDKVGGINGLGEPFWTRLGELYSAPLNTLAGDGKPADPQIKVEL